MACSTLSAPTFLNMGITRQAWHLSGAETPDRSDNCQAGVFLGYASRKGATLLDRRLYLPAVWFTQDYQERWRACAIPADTPFQTKHELAADLVTRVVQSGRIRARWVVCDEGFGD